MSYFLGKNLKVYSKRIALAILLAVLFAPTLPLNISLAQTTAPRINTTLAGTRINDESATGNCPVDTVPAQTIGQFSKPVVEERGGILLKMGLNDTVDAYVAFKPVVGSFGASAQDKLNTILANCKTQAAAGQIVFFVTLQAIPISGNNLVRGQGTAVYNDQTQTLEGNVKGLKLPSGMRPSDIPAEPSDTRSPIFSVNYIVQFRPANGSGTFQRTMYQHETGFSGTVLNANQETLAITQVSGSTTTDDTPKDNYPIERIKLGLHSTQEKKGFETLYRYAKDDPDADRKANVTIPFYIEWLGEGDSPKVNQTVVRQQDTLLTATFLGFYFGVGKYYKNDVDIPKCGTGWTDFWCTSLLLQQEPKTAQPLPAGGLLKLTYANVQQGENGEIPTSYTTKPSAVKLFMGLPLASFKSSNDNAIRSSNRTPISIEIYETFEDLKKACEESAKSDGKEVDCTKPENLYYGQKYETVVADQSDDTPSSLVGNLFSFLRQVIAYIVLLLTGIIYYIFSSILVPVIVALIGIHPYKDAFVNFIYPGWVILRNISNIFFIVALLWIGLRTIFQMEDAAKSRTFILRLILAALLVNFSLVIAQAIVGIADTVQAQFLPAENKVVETLGFKLMVEPIITFRGTEGGGQDNYGLTEGGNFTTKGLASDLPKAVILLVLAISAFFAFVALIAFLIVRIVALWLLYMVSPIAYVGRILPQTEQASSKWWSEFIKYAFALPIMGFFLNVAALLAVTMSKPTGQSVQTGNSNTTVLWGIINTGSIASEFVSFATTVLSHFLVLVFMYGGMLFAMRFGGKGSEKIVDYAKKGFDAVTTKAPKWLGRTAADNTAEFLANRDFAKKRPGFDTLFRSVARPGEALKAVKKGYFDEPRKAQNKRFADKFDDVANKWQPWGEDKLRPAKMLMWKLRGKNAPALLSQAAQLQDQLGIMDNDDRDAMVAKLEAANLDKDRNQEILERLDNGKLGLFAANNELARLEKLHDDTEQQILDEKDPIKKKDLRNLSDEIKERKDALGVAIAAVPAGQTDLDISSITKFDKDELTEVLQKQIDQADELSVQIQPELDKDKELRDRYGITKMDSDIRKEISQKAADLTATAQEREWPYSKAVEKAEAAKIKEEQKELVDLDYDQLEDVYTSALKKNNLAQAKAAIKQMAENGQVSKLLESNKLGNNVEDLAKLIAKDFKGTQRSQVQVIRDVSNLSAKNGNNSLAYAVTSIKGGGGMLNTLQTQQNKLAEGKQKSIFEAKTDDLIYTDSAGNKNFNKGVFEKVLKPNNTETRSFEMKKKLDPKVAAKVWDVIDKQPNLKAQLSPHFIKAIDEVRLKD